MADGKMDKPGINENTFYIPFEKHGWYGLRTIEDLWNDLYFEGKISDDEVKKIKLMNHEEQQTELEKYK